MTEILVQTWHGLCGHTWKQSEYGDQCPTCAGENRFVPLPDGRTLDTHGLSNSGWPMFEPVRPSSAPDADEPTVFDGLCHIRPRPIPEGCATVRVNMSEGTWRSLNSEPPPGEDDIAEVTARVKKQFAEEFMVGPGNWMYVPAGGLSKALAATDPAAPDTTQEIPVTDEMTKRAEWLANRMDCTPDDILVVYRAMHAVAPVPLVSEAEDRIAWLEAECKRLADGPPTQHPPEFVAKVLMDREGRDDPMALARLTEVIRCARLDGRKQARGELAALAKERDKLQAQNDAFQATFVVISDQLAVKEDRIAELDSELAKRPAALTDPVHGDSKPNPFREFPSDPRRMGPVLPK